MHAEVAKLVARSPGRALWLHTLDIPVQYRAVPPLLLNALHAVGSAHLLPWFPFFRPAGVQCEF